ncbi:hypothetical protein [Methylobacterium durans]|uniref:hypothetical protein n=1 Tax=Methylobacterium durans TaxID=2202825 RepID=UPI0013A56512|nr:hypothetical protein [Methylobacterium durans]
MTPAERAALKQELAACLTKASAIAAVRSSAPAAPVDAFRPFAKAAHAWGLIGDAARKKAKRLAHDYPQRMTKRGGRWPCTGMQGSNELRSEAIRQAPQSLRDAPVRTAYIGLVCRGHEQVHELASVKRFPVREAVHDHLEGALDGDDARLEIPRLHFYPDHRLLVAARDNRLGASEILVAAEQVAGGHGALTMPRSSSHQRGRGNQERKARADSDEFGSASVCSARRSDAVQAMKITDLDHDASSTSVNLALLLVIQRAESLFLKTAAEQDPRRCDFKSFG